ncbi:MAG: ATP-binding cassette domain-containing protein [Myxococcota bacterium]
MIECRGLAKQYGDLRVVDRIDLEVAEGETLVLIGASGCGKTTTLKMINRLVEPSEGEVLIAGEATTHLAPHLLRRRIGYGAQQAGLFPHLNIAQNVGITPKLLGWAPERIAERVDALLAQVDLAPGQYRDRRPESLSGGEQQRVSLARALAAEPKVLLLDEPFGALDPVTRDRLQEALRELSRSLSLTVVFVTHDMAEALLLADRIAFIEDGRIAQLGTPTELLRNPATEKIAHFLRAPRRQASQIERLTAGLTP